MYCLVSIPASQKLLKTTETGKKVARLIFSDTATVIMNLSSEPQSFLRSLDYLLCFHAEPYPR